jgi:hypothetical protein
MGEAGRFELPTPCVQGGSQLLPDLVEPCGCLLSLEAPDRYVFDSSEESVGEFRLGQLAK